MGPGEPRAPSPRAALDAAGRALRDAQLADRDEIRAALGVLRKAAQAHDAAVRAAAERLDDARRGAGDVEAAERALAEAQAAQRGVEEARPLLHRLPGLVDAHEAVLDMAGGISAGHEGIVVVGERRLLFVSLRRTVVHAYADVTGVSAKGRWFGTRLVVSTTGERLVVSGMAPQRAADLEALVRERLEAVAPAAG